jgi:hypothetical protein
MKTKRIMVTIPDDIESEKQVKALCLRLRTNAKLKEYGDEN